MHLAGLPESAGLLWLPAWGSSPSLFSRGAALSASLLAAKLISIFADASTLSFGIPLVPSAKYQVEVEQRAVT